MITPVARRRILPLSAPALALLSGCAWDEAAFRQTTTVKAPYAAGQGLKVKARNGPVAVHPAEGAEVVIIATLRMITEERLAGTTLVADRNPDGVLEVYAKPPEGGWRSNEGVGFDICMPQPGPVDLASDNGHIECTGMSGRGVFETSNGSVTVLDHDGAVSAETSNGRVQVTGATGPVEARTSNGSVRIALADPGPGPVRVHTSNGSVTLELGRSFRGEIGVHTSNGSISLPSAGEGLRVDRDGRHSARLRVGEGGGASEIETSNGSVTVRR